MLVATLLSAPLRYVLQFSTALRFRLGLCRKETKHWSLFDERSGSWRLATIDRVISQYLHLTQIRMKNTSSRVRAASYRVFTNPSQWPAVCTRFIFIAPLPAFSVMLHRFRRPRGPGRRSFACFPHRLSFPPIRVPNPPKQPTDVTRHDRLLPDITLQCILTDAF